MTYRKKIICSIGFLFLLSVLIMLRIILSKGYISLAVDDTFTYVSWAWQFIEAIKQGNIYPRWTPINFWGYGSPTFILYPPLAFYFTAFFNIFTDSLIDAMSLTKFMSFFLSSMGIFYLLRENYSIKIALFSASIYIIFPHNVNTFYATFSSAVSFMWFSPILLFAYRYFKGGEYKYLFFSGVCYGGLILTHLINAYMFTFVIIGFGICMSITKKRVKDINSALIILIIGILISSAYILPLLYEKQFLNLHAFTGKESGFNYSEYFILPNLSSLSPVNHFWFVFYDEIVFTVSLICIFIVISFINMLKMRSIRGIKNIKIFNIFMLLVACYCLFLLFGASTFIWEGIPYFRFIQFPIRWLNILTFSVACLSANWLYMIKNIYVKGGILPYMAIIFTIFFTCIIFDFRYIYNAPIIKEKDLIPVKDINWTMEHLPKSVNLNEIDKQNRPYRNIEMYVGNGKADIVKWDSHERVISITDSRSLTLRIRSFNFPGWKALINGMQAEIRTDVSNGAMLIDIPDGENILKLNFVDTPIRYYSKYISLLSFALFSFILLIKRGNMNSNVRE